MPREGAHQQQDDDRLGAGLRGRAVLHAFEEACEESVTANMQHATTSRSQREALMRVRPEQARKDNTAIPW